MATGGEAGGAAGGGVMSMLEGGNFGGVVNSLGKGPLKKVAHAVLQWVYSAVGKNGDEAPGAKKGETSQKDFMSVFKNGAILGQLANKLKPGAIPTVHEGDAVTAEQEAENLDNFRNFAKEEAGVQESSLFQKEDVQAGSQKGFSGLLSTLMSLGSQAKEKFAQDGLSMDTITKIATSEAGKNFFQNLIGRFFKKQPQGVEGGSG